MALYIHLRVWVMQQTQVLQNFLLVYAPSHGGTATAQESCRNQKQMTGINNSNTLIQGPTKPQQGSYPKSPR
jgi:hypothetical protein